MSKYRVIGLEQAKSMLGACLRSNDEYLTVEEALSEDGFLSAFVAKIANGQQIDVDLMLD